PEIEDRILIISDPMLATGASLVKTIQYIKEEGTPKAIHIVAAIACSVGIEYVVRNIPEATIWCGDIDDELTAKGYIVPGLGDAGDLAYGVKVQS
ncbi:MAG TPA: uracil phosphoribosyltransferase, partial [Flavisolibacter sp.]|nr:uracil phosphoribosyltransferase [Flavisolibacter sp.]